MSNSAHQIERLMQWYAEHRDDEWEHRHGLKLEASDDGGWLLIIDTTGTELEGHETKPVRIERAVGDWLDWRFEAKGFHATGGARNVCDMIAVFFDELDRLAQDTGDAGARR